MAITSLSEVTNDYGSYRGNSLIGDRGAAVTVPNDGLAGIVGKPYPFLNGILVKIGGTIYTDNGYLNALKAAGNPYLSKRSLPMVTLSLGNLTQEVEDVIVHGDTTRTKYAEVAVTRRMSSVEDILRYLNDFFNPNTTDTVLAPQVLGGFSFLTTTYSADLDVNGLYPGLEFETFEDIATATTVKISTPPTLTTPKVAEPRPVVDVVEEKPLSVVKPKIEIKKDLTTAVGNRIKADFFKLDDSVDNTRQILSTSNGLQITGLKDVYDTGDFGPMADILDRLDGLGTSGISRFGSFNRGF